MTRIRSTFSMAQLLIDRAEVFIERFIFSAMAPKGDNGQKATSAMEWRVASDDFVFEHDADPELDESMSECKWRKCGAMTGNNASSCSEIAAEAALSACGCVVRKYKLKQVSKCGRYKHFTHKYRKSPAIIIREIQDYVLAVKLVAATEKTYTVSFMNDVGIVAVATLEKGHNIGYANVLAREAFRLAAHVRVKFKGFSESGRCNMWKALTSQKGADPRLVAKRPALKQTTLK